MSELESTSQDRQTKPAPIRVGVEGIAPKPIELTPAARERVDWSKVAGLPAFQMFVCEAAPCPPDRDVLQWAADYAVRYAGQRGDGALMADYNAWHGAKGHWPNETPLGVLKG